MSATETLKLASETVRGDPGPGDPLAPLSDSDSEALIAFLHVDNIAEAAQARGMTSQRALELITTPAAERRLAAIARFHAVRRDVRSDPIREEMTGVLRSIALDKARSPDCRQRAAATVIRIVDPWRSAPILLRSIDSDRHRPRTSARPRATEDALSRLPTRSTRSTPAPSVLSPPANDQMSGQRADAPSGVAPGASTPPEAPTVLSALRDAIRATDGASAVPDRATEDALSFPSPLSTGSTGVPSLPFTAIRATDRATEEALSSPPPPSTSSTEAPSAPLTVPSDSLTPPAANRDERTPSIHAPHRAPIGTARAHRTPAALAASAGQLGPAP